MAHKKQTYAMGYGKEATSSHSSRTAKNDASFLLRHLTSDSQILDVGCGPGTITADFCSMVPQGFVTGVDMSPEVLRQAAGLANARPGGCPTNLDFFAVDVLKPGWAVGKPDKNASEPSALPETWKNQFDVIFESQTFSHIPDPVGALRKLMLCLKPGGLLALRDYDCGSFIFHPDPTGKLRRWLEYTAMINTAEGAPSPWGGRNLYEYCLEAGLEPDKIDLSVSGLIYRGPEQQKWWGELHAERLNEGKGPRRILMEKCNITGEEIDEVRGALLDWSKTPNGLFSAIAFEVVARP